MRLVPLLLLFILLSTVSGTDIRPEPCRKLQEFNHYWEDIVAAAEERNFLQAENIKTELARSLRRKIDELLQGLAYLPAHDVKLCFDRIAASTRPSSMQIHDPNADPVSTLASLQIKKKPPTQCPGGVPITDPVEKPAAFVAYLGSERQDYMLGALGWAQSLLLAKTSAKIVLLVHPDTDDRTIRFLTTTGVFTGGVRKVPTFIANPYRQDKYRDVFGKVYAWSLTDYAKVVMMDVDTFALTNIDELFDKPELSAVQDVATDSFNSGLMVLRPDCSTFTDIVLAIGKKASGVDGGDQGLLNNVFTDWHPLPVTYNAFNRMAMEPFCRMYETKGKPVWPHILKDLQYHADPTNVTCRQLYEHGQLRGLIKVVHFASLKPWGRHWPMTDGWRGMFGEALADPDTHPYFTNVMLWERVYDSLPYKPKLVS